MSIHHLCLCGHLIHEADHPTWDAYRTARPARAETCPLRMDRDVSRAFENSRQDGGHHGRGNRPGAGQTTGGVAAAPSSAELTPPVLAPMSHARLAWLWTCVVAVFALTAWWSWAATRT